MFDVGSCTPRICWPQIHADSPTVRLVIAAVIHLLRRRAYAMSAAIANTSCTTLSIATPISRGAARAVRMVIAMKVPTHPTTSQNLFTVTPVIETRPP